MTAAHQQCEWLRWFDQFDTEDAIRRAAYAPVVPVRDLMLLSPEDACRKLDHAWKAIFLPGPPHLQILRSLIDNARGFARAKYPTVKDHNRLLCGDGKDTIARQPIRCLAGLAGVSKTSLVQAFERICRLQPTADFLSDGQRLMIHPVRIVEIKEPAVQGILQGLANPLAVAGREKKQIPSLIEHLPKWFAATATSLLVADELQFFTRSSSASTKTSQLIMTLASLDVPLLYVANYSLIRKLMLRPQEEKDRLLAAPTILEPPAADAQWWTDVVAECFAVSPETFKLDAVTNAETLHRLTAGLVRALRELLGHAYREARLQGKHVVTMESVKLAYRGRGYSSHRKDVEDLASLAVSSLMAEKRPDLACPFDEVPITRRAWAGKAQERQLPSPQPSRFDAAAVLIESAIRAPALATLRKLRRAANLPAGELKPATVTRLPRRTPVSADTLLQGAQVLRDAMSKPRPLSKKPSGVPEISDGETS